MYRPFAKNSKGKQAQEGAVCVAGKAVDGVYHACGVKGVEYQYAHGHEYGHCCVDDGPGGDSSAALRMTGGWLRMTRGKLRMTGGRLRMTRGRLRMARGRLRMTGNTMFRITCGCAKDIYSK